MSNVLWKSLLLSTAILGAALVSATSTIAAPLLSYAAPTSRAEVNQPQAAQALAPALHWLALNSRLVKPTVAKAKSLKVNVAFVQKSLKVATIGIPTSQTTATSEQLTLTQKEVPTQVRVTPKAQLVADKPAASITKPGSGGDDIDQVVRYGKEGNGTQDDSIGQVTSVSQLRDVQPTDWAFQALQSLVERYGCIAGYPDGTYRGNRALTRYEFAAGLNSCLNRVNELIAAGTSDLVRKEDIATLQKLQQDFSTELTALRGRVDNLEAQTAQLEANQFSTTTKLVGEGIFAITDEFNNPTNTNTVFQDRVRLDLQTSFTGRDTLHTRLAAGNAQRLSFQSVPGAPTLGTYEGSQTFNLSSTSNNSVAIDWLSYYFPIGKAQAYVAAFGGIHSDYAPTTSPYFEGFTGGTGALSVFAEDNAIYDIGGGSGAALNIPFGKPGTILGASSLSVGYLAGNAFRPLGNNANPVGGSGIFHGDYAALGQLNFNLGDRFALGGTYVHAYNSAGSGIFNLGTPENIVAAPTNTTSINGVVGTVQANDPSILLAGGLRPIVSNSYGGEIAFRPSSKISLNGWVDYTRATILGRGNADIWSYAGGIAFPDFGKQGSILGLFAGVEPTLTGLRARGGPARFTRNNAYHAEGFYKYQLSDNISITPGVIVLFDPGQNKNNADDVIGTLRTTFTF